VHATAAAGEFFAKMLPLRRAPFEDRCVRLDYTTATASDAMDEEPRGPKAAS